MTYNVFGGTLNLAQLPQLMPSSVALGLLSVVVTLCVTVPSRFGMTEICAHEFFP